MVLFHSSTKHAASHNHRTNLPLEKEEKSNQNANQKHSLQKMKTNSLSSKQLTWVSIVDALCSFTTLAKCVNAVFFCLVHFQHPYSKHVLNLSHLRCRYRYVGNYLLFALRLAAQWLQPNGLWMVIKTVATMKLPELCVYVCCVVHYNSSNYQIV